MVGEGLPKYMSESTSELKREQNSFLRESFNRYEFLGYVKF